MRTETPAETAKLSADDMPHASSLHPSWVNGPLQVSDSAASTVSKLPTQVRAHTVPVNVGVKAFAPEMTSYADACGVFASSQCRFHQNAQTVTVIFARLNPPTLTNPNPS